MSARSDLAPDRRRTPLDPLVAPERLTALRPAARAVRSAYRQATGQLRHLPDFLVIGAQKSGTTTLFEHLAQHPGIRPSATKEVHYFDREYDRGERWYRGHFALAARAERSGLLTGEATPAYLVHPSAPERARRTVPDARLVAVLRDPVDRAFSHYQHEVAKGFECYGFEEALACEPSRLAAAPDGEASDGALIAAFEHHTYLARGRYAEQLERWLAHFPAEQLLVLAAEELYGDPDAAMARVAEHLGLPPVMTGLPVVRNSRSYSPMSAKTRSWLQRYYAPHNQRLFELLGTTFDWS